MNYNTSYFTDDHRAFAETIRKFTAQEITPIGGGTEAIMKDLASRQLGY